MAGVTVAVRGTERSSRPGSVGERAYLGALAAPGSARGRRVRRFRAIAGEVRPTTQASRADRRGGHVRGTRRRPGCREHHVGVPDGDDGAEVEGHHPVARRLAAGSRSCSMTTRLAPRAARGRAAAAARALRPHVGRSRSTARRAARRGAGARRPRRGPRSGGSRRELVHEAVAVGAETEELDELVDPVVDGGSDVVTAGRWSAAATGSRTSTEPSSATARVSVTVRAGKRRASWKERPRPWLGPGRGRASGSRRAGVRRRRGRSGPRPAARSR